MDDIRVRFTVGPAYFGEPRLIRDVFEIIMQAAMGHTRKIVTNVVRSDDPKVGILAEAETTAHPDAPKQIVAAIRQAMLLPDTVPIELTFEESDVMEPDNIDDLLEAVNSAQKGLRDVTSNMFDQLIWYY